MTASQITSRPAAPSPAAEDPHAVDDLLAGTDPVGAALAHVAAAALRDDAPGTGGHVGLELEFHLVPLATPQRRPSWAEVQRLVAELPPMPGASTVTVEPGGQLELSTPPRPDVGAAIDTLRADRAVLRSAVRTAGFGTVALGADPARPVERINPNPRYVAMEQHFAALGCATPGTAMMAATAALQVNVDAGPRSGWAARLRRLHDLGPVLVTISACSPVLGGTASGWRSMRQQAWLGIDPGRSGAANGGDEDDGDDPQDPVTAWADYALAAPVLLVRGADGHVEPLRERVPFAAWLRGEAPIERRPTGADLDYHLTTLFPPVRPKGYVELRCIDAVPDRWWPALAAIVATLADHPGAADQLARLCAPVRGRWTAAAERGLADPHLRRAAVGCVELAAQLCPAPLRAAVAAYADLVAAGRTPGDEVRERVAATDPATVLEEEARA